MKLADYSFRPRLGQKLLRQYLAERPERPRPPPGDEPAQLVLRRERDLAEYGGSGHAGKPQPAPESPADTLPEAAFPD